MSVKEKFAFLKTFDFKSIFPRFSEKINPLRPTNEALFDVVFALSPAAIFGCAIFGLRAALVIAVSVVSAIIFEFLWNLIFKKPQTLGDFSAIITGLVLGMNFPPNIPLWMVIFASFIAVIAVKQFWGGIGRNFINPATTALVVLTTCFPAAMTKFVIPFAINTATPVRNDFFGIQSGRIGETSAFILLIGGLYLVIRRIINPIIPISFIGTVAIACLFDGQDVLLSIFGGNLILGAIFMASDFATCPTTNLGKLIFGIGCGVITAIMRHFTFIPESVIYPIFIMNLLTPFINIFVGCKPFGYDETKKVNFNLKDFFKNVFGKIVALFEKIKVFISKHNSNILRK